MYYRQCKLVKNISVSIQNNEPNNLELSQTSFIPEEFAVVKRKIKIRERGEEGWDTGWEVKEVSSIRTDEKHLPDSHKEIKSHRKSTGDNTPKVKNE